MGERIDFPRASGGCRRWRPGTAAISLAARPACAALAGILAETGRRDRR